MIAPLLLTASMMACEFPSREIRKEITINLSFQNAHSGESCTPVDSRFCFAVEEDSEIDVDGHLRKDKTWGTVSSKCFNINDLEIADSGDYNFSTRFKGIVLEEREVFHCHLHYDLIDPYTSEVIDQNIEADFCEDYYLEDDLEMENRQLEVIFNLPHC